MVMGASMSRSRAISYATRVVPTPSATIPKDATTSSRLIPAAMPRPTRWFRERGLAQVTMRSPMPARPEKVRGSAPRAVPSRAISARPRVINIARTFSPRSIPAAAPETMAMTFFSAPASSTPTTSRLS